MTACLLLVMAGVRQGDRSTAGWVPAAFVTLFASITAVGYVLSALNRFSEAGAWLSILAPLAFVLIAVTRVRVVRPAIPKAAERPHIARDLRWHWIVIVSVGAVVAAMQFVLIVATAPHNADSLTYHMARVGYYLQHGNIDSYPANYWAQLMHPKNSAIGMSFLVLVAKGWSNAAQFLQFLAWPVLVASNYGICCRLDIDRRAGAIVALASGLIVEVLMQSTTTQDDLYIAAMGAAFIYFSIGFLLRPTVREGLLLGAAAGLAFGTKLSAVVMLLPACVVVAGVACSMRMQLGAKDRLVRLALIATGFLAGCALFGLPAGYWENWRIYGSPMGDPSVIAGKSLQGTSLSGRAELGVINAARFALDFIDPSGLPMTGVPRRSLLLVRHTAAHALKKVGLDIEAAPTLSTAYDPTNAAYEAHEDLSYWGIWAWAFFVPAIVLGAANPRHRASAMVFLSGGVLFWLLQAFTGIYDPWRGRYFIQAVVFVVPAAALGVALLSHTALRRAVLMCLIAVCCAVSFDAVRFRSLSHWRSSLRLDWVGQVTRNAPTLDPVLRRLDVLVPQDASLIVTLEMAQGEFPMFGRRMTRKLYPAPDQAEFAKLRSEGRGDFLVFNRLFEALPTDCALGEGFYLRKLGPGTLSGCKSDQVN
jgi:hypothetical protein